MFSKSKSKKIAIFLTILFCFLFTWSNFASAQLVPEVKYPKIGQREIIEETELPDYIIYIFSLAIIIGVIITIGVLIFGGFLYLTSTGKPEQLREATGRISAAFLGLIILLGSYLILNTVNPQLTLIKINLVDIRRGVRLIDGDKTEVTEISISYIQKRFGVEFEPTKVEIVKEAKGLLKARAYESPNYDKEGKSSDWITDSYEVPENEDWFIQSLKIRGIGSGIYLYGPDPEQIFHLITPHADFSKVDNFDNKAKKIEIENLIVGGEKKTDFAAILFPKANFEGEFRIFIEKRNEDRSGKVEPVGSDLGNVPWDRLNTTSTNEATLSIPAPDPYDDYGKIKGPSSAYVFQIEPGKCKKVTLYKNPNFYDDPDDKHDVCEITKPIYKPVDIEDDAACGQWDDWSDKAQSIEIDPPGSCLVALFEHDKCVPPLGCAVFRDLATGKHSEIFTYNDPDLSDNRIGQCKTIVSIFQGVSQPCASAIAVYPLR